jgi:hypothetical protein
MICKTAANMPATQLLVLTAITEVGIGEITTRTKNAPQCKKRLLTANDRKVMKSFLACRS